MSGRTLLVFVGGAALGLGVIAFFLLGGTTTYQVKILSPRESALVTRNFVVDVAIAGERAPETLEILVGETVVGTHQVDPTLWSDPGSALVTAIRAEAATLQPGWHEIRVRPEGGEPTPGQRVWIADDLGKTRASYEEIEALQAVLEDELPETIVAIGRARSRDPERWFLDERYRDARDATLSKAPKGEVRDLLAELFQVIETDPMEAVLLASDRINAALLRGGFPLWVTIFETRYRGRPPRTILLTYRLDRPLPFEAGGASYEALVATRLDTLNVRELMLGHRSTGVAQAVLLVDRIDQTSRELYTCLEATFADCVADWGDRYTYEHVPPERLEAIIEALRAELGELVGGSCGADCEHKVRRALLESVAYHEIRHVIDHREGVPFSKALLDKLDRAREDVVLADPNNLLGRVELEEAAYTTIRGANLEMSAYLAQLAEAPGLRRYLLLKLLVFATLDYHDGTDEAWAARAILARLGAAIGRTTPDDLHRGYDDPRWYAIAAPLFELDLQRLSTLAAQVYRDEFGGYTRAAIIDE